MNGVESDGNTPLTVTIERRVEFADTDATGHHHYLAVLRWLEHAERVLHEQLGIADATLGRLPRVHLEVDFFAAVHYREPIELTLTVERVGRTSLTHSFRVGSGPLLVAAGRYVVVLSADNDGRSTPWPVEVRERLRGSGCLPGERMAVPRVPAPRDAVSRESVSRESVSREPVSRDPAPVTTVVVDSATG